MKTKKVKPDPTKDAKTYPFMLVKRYADPRYFRSWKEARAAIIKELTDQQDVFESLQWDDSLAAINKVIKQAGQLWPERGAVVQGVVDPMTGAKYSAELVKREQP